MVASRTVLFICVENSCRSLMAESMFNANPPPGWVATSAGTSPSAGPNPRTGPMLAELGFSLPGHPPQPLTAETMETARVRVTMGCLDDASCPAHLKTLELRDWALPNPAQLDDDGFRKVRDRIAAHVRGLRSELIVADRAAAARQRSAPQ
jgi:arsenate reductase (thioredoxin)